MGVLSEEFKIELGVRYKMDVGIISTSVFTNKPVPMKYRGVFKLDERSNGVIYYIQQAGTLGKLRDILKSYIEKNIKQHEAKI